MFLYVFHILFHIFSSSFSIYRSITPFLGSVVVVHHSMTEVVETEG